MLAVSESKSFDDVGAMRIFFKEVDGEQRKASPRPSDSVDATDNSHSSSATEVTGATSSMPASNIHSTVKKPEPIFFYHRDDPYFDFTNFAEGFEIEYDGNKYPSSEHLFQAFKFLDNRPDLALRLRGLYTARQAFEFSRKYYKEERPDWLDVRLEKMEMAVDLKFTQHRFLHQALCSTNDAEIVEDSPYDSYWGCGKDRTGANMLGKILMTLRAKFRGDMALYNALRKEYGLEPAQKAAAKCSKVLRKDPPVQDAR